MISVPSAMQFMPERWRESLTPKSKTPHSLTVVMLTHSLRRVTWRHVLSLKDFTYSIIIERTPPELTQHLEIEYDRCYPPWPIMIYEIRIGVLLVADAGLWQRAITELDGYRQQWTKLDWTLRAGLDYYFWWMFLDKSKRLAPVSIVPS